ncbi:hypothetical protein RJT34_11627 [Clitoria ternatea]|uniref:Cucumisin n=1 Tax=Clitoria ternatea TaxID=43366 RepID=A0AAN9JKF6_CLITE
MVRTASVSLYIGSTHRASAPRLPSDIDFYIVVDFDKTIDGVVMLEITPLGFGHRNKRVGFEQSREKNKAQTRMYIVYMGSYPKDLESTKLPHTNNTDITGITALRIKTKLHTDMLQAVLGRELASEALLHSYQSFNGFVANITEKEAAKLRGLDGVVSVIPNTIEKPQTTISWDFLGFPVNVIRSPTESDLVVGVLDTGAWPEHPSFDGSQFGPIPIGWRGSCLDPTFSCNNKLIGANYFRASGRFGVHDSVSPRDTNGHGTHCASIAVGNVVGPASLFGYGSGTARGGAPLARLAVYKVCWELGCDTADILAGYDTAIADGVHILSVSVGPSSLQSFPNAYFEDVHAIGSFHAMQRGILTSKAAGNLGSQPKTIPNTAPWLLTVAASTTPRTFTTEVRLGDGNKYQSVSVNTFDLGNTMYPLIYGGDIPNRAEGWTPDQSRLCYENSLDKVLARGKIVLCDDYLGPQTVGFVSGAVGAIFRSSGSLVVADVFALPAAHVNNQDGNQIYSYLKSTSNPTATILRSLEGRDSNAPYVAPFSSRGPNRITPDLLQPDITAPGVHILAAWPKDEAPLSGVWGDDRESYFNIMSGTSQACPHVTAVATYLKSFNPDWSPAAIKSAIMTTANPLRAAHAPSGDAEFGYGAGQLSPIQALNPGLVYDADQNDYVEFLCGQGYDTATLRIITGDGSTCTQGNRGLVWDLNLPTFTYSTTLSTTFNVLFHRSVTIVGPDTYPSSYRATLATYPSTLRIQVVPNELVFTSANQKLPFTVQIEGYITSDMVSTSLVWSDGIHTVRSPIVVYVRS